MILWCECLSRTTSHTFNFAIAWGIYEGGGGSQIDICRASIITPSIFSNFRDSRIYSALSVGSFGTTQILETRIDRSFIPRRLVPFPPPLTTPVTQPPPTNFFQFSIQDSSGSRGCNGGLQMKIVQFDDLTNSNKYYISNTSFVPNSIDVGADFTVAFLWCRSSTDHNKHPKIKSLKN